MSNDNALCRLLFEAASDAILVMQHDQAKSAWVCVDGNASAAALFDCEQEELLGQTLLNFSPPSQPDGRDSQLVLEAKLEAALAGEMPRFEWLCQRLDAEKFYAHVALVGVEFEGDAFVQVAVHNIAEDKQLAAALAESEKRFRTILDSIQTGVVIIDADTREIVDVNSAGLNMMDAKRENVIGSVCHQFICPAEQGRCPVCDLGQRVDNSERVLLTAHNEQLPIIKYVVPTTLDNRTYLIESFVDISERKRVEEELRKLSRVVEQSANTIVITDTKGYIEYVNPKFTETTGYSREEALGQHTRILKSGETSSDEYKKLWQTITAGAEWRGEFQNKKKNGELYWELASISPIKNEQGHITHFLAVKEEITERKRLELALHKSERRLANIIDFFPYPTFAIDNQGQVIAWNRASEEALGVKAEEMLGKGDFEYALPFYGQRRPILIDLVSASPEELEQNYTNVHREGETLVGESIVYPQGQERYFVGAAAPLYDAQGNIAGAIETFRDITEQNQSEAARQESEQRLADIIDFLPTPTFVIDLEGNVIAWNQALAEVTGVKAEDILGKGNYEYALPFFGKRRPLLIDLIFEPEEEVTKKYTNVRREGNSLVAENRVFPRGIERHYLLSAAPLYDVQGNLVGAIENFRDITEQKRAEEELRQYQGQLEELVEARTTELENRVRELNALQRLMSYEGWQEYQASRQQAAPGYLFDQATVRPVGREELEISTNGQTQAESLADMTADKFNGHKTVTKPLAVSGESIGTLGIYEDDPDNSLSPEDQTFLDEVAVQVAEALERARLLEQSRSALAETETLYRAGRRITEADNLQEVVAAVMEVSSIPAIKRAALLALELDSAGDVETMTVVANWHSDEGTEPTAIGTIYSKAMLASLNILLTSEPLFFGDVQHDDRTNPALKAILQQRNIQAVAVVPLWIGSRHVGSLVLEAEETCEFSDQDIRLILALADQAAVAIDNQRLFQETRTALAEVEATQRRYTVQAWEAYRARRRNRSYEEDREGVPPLGEMLPPEAGRAVTEKKPIVFTAPPVLVDDVDDAEAAAVKVPASLTVPLAVRNEVIGVLGLQNTAEARHWTPEEISLVEAIAEQVAQAAEQIRLFDETQQRAAREQRVGEIGDKIRAAQSLEEALQVAIKEVGLSLKAPQTTVKLAVE